MPMPLDWKFWNHQWCPRIDNERNGKVTNPEQHKILYVHHYYNGLKTCTFRDVFEADYAKLNPH